MNVITYPEHGDSKLLCNTGAYLLFCIAPHNKSHHLDTYCCVNHISLSFRRISQSRNSMHMKSQRGQVPHSQKCVFPRTFKRLTSQSYVIKTHLNIRFKGTCPLTIYNHNFMCVSCSPTFHLAYIHHHFNNEKQQTQTTKILFT
jgi:hypothetical protein